MTDDIPLTRTNSERMCLIRMYGKRIADWYVSGKKGEVDEMKAIVVRLNELLDSVESYPHGAVKVD